MVLAMMLVGGLSSLAVRVQIQAGAVCEEGSPGLSWWRRSELERKIGPHLLPEDLASPKQSTHTVWLMHV
jgi:hypothetical protein